MKYFLFKTLSQINKTVLPKLYKKQDFTKFSKAELALAAYKRWVTFGFMDARDERKKG